MEITQQTLLQAMEQISKTPDQIVVIHGGNEPELKIRFMPTAGGVQFCVKEVSWRGEMGGNYFQPDQIEAAAEYAFELHRRHLETGKKISERFNRPLLERTLHIVNDFQSPAPFARSLDNDPIFKDATTITLG